MGLLDRIFGTKDLTTPPKLKPRGEVSGRDASKSGKDMETPGPNFESSELYGNRRAFGGEITNAMRLFSSKREPIMKWLVDYVASDIYDNGFKVVPVDNEDDLSYDKEVQKVLADLKAKKALTRLCKFERRYGTAVLLYSYSTLKKVDWSTPIYDDDGKLLEETKIMQITPYPWTKVNVIEKVKDVNDLRYGLPLYYEITRDGSSPLKVHWQRVTHAAPRLDEHPFEGVSVMDAMWDDATGWRNMRWGLFQTIWRYGSGFPWFNFPKASQEDIDKWIDDGGPSDFFSHAYFVSGKDGSTVKFVGLEGASLEPKAYIDMAFASMAMASKIPQDILKGVSAGAITGSEFNERNYFKYISGEQSDIEEAPTDLIRRLKETGQITDKESKLVWVEGVELNALDKARIRQLNALSAKSELEYRTIDEVRVAGGDKPLPNGEGAKLKPAPVGIPGG